MFTWPWPVLLTDKSVERENCDEYVHEVPVFRDKHKYKWYDVTHIIITWEIKMHFTEMALLQMKLYTSYLSLTVGGE